MTYTYKGQTLYSVSTKPDPKAFQEALRKWRMEIIVAELKKAQA